MSEIPSLVKEWIRERRKWHYVWQPHLQPFPMQPGEMIQIPNARHAFSSTEGLLIQFSAAFTNPNCGIRMENANNMDTGSSFTVGLISGSGFYNMLFPVTVMGPPVAPFYVIDNIKEWGWSDWMRLYVFNTDATNTYYCINYGYTIAMLDEKPGSKTDKNRET